MTFQWYRFTARTGSPSLPRAQRAPAPHVYLEVDDLIERVRQTGLAVQLDVTGTVAPLPPAVGQTVRRVVQEALTNTIRHAYAHEATVELRYDVSELVVQVRDDGAGRVPAVAGTGRGLSGTPCELDVLRKLVHGHSNAEIAAAPYLGETMVKTHVASVLRKLGLRDRAQAVIVGYETGLVRPGDAGP
jgi:DNA-binding CsgD family transcriptional regulator